MPTVRILDEYCKGCELCISVCPKDVLVLSERFNKKGLKVAEVHRAEACTGCMNCAVICPDVAIEILESAPEAKAKK